MSGAMSMPVTSTSSPPARAHVTRARGMSAAPVPTSRIVTVRPGVHATRHRLEMSKHDLLFRRIGDSSVRGTGASRPTTGAGKADGVHQLVGRPSAARGRRRERGHRAERMSILHQRGMGREARAERADDAQVARTRRTPSLLLVEHEEHGRRRQVAERRAARRAPRRARSPAVRARVRPRRGSSRPPACITQCATSPVPSAMLAEQLPHQPPARRPRPHGHIAAEHVPQVPAFRPEAQRVAPLGQRQRPEPQETRRERRRRRANPRDRRAAGSPRRTRRRRSRWTPPGPARRRAGWRHCRSRC